MDEEIVKAITLNLALAAVLSSLRQRDKARLFALRVNAGWMAMR